MLKTYVRARVWLDHQRARARDDGERGDTIERVIGYGIGALAAAAISYGLWRVAEGGVDNIDLGF